MPSRLSVGVPDERRAVKSALTPPFRRAGVFRHDVSVTESADNDVCSDSVLVPQLVPSPAVTVTCGLFVALVLSSLCVTSSFTVLIVDPAGIWLAAGIGQLAAGENCRSVSVRLVTVDDSSAVASEPSVTW